MKTAYETEKAMADISAQGFISSLTRVFAENGMSSLLNKERCEQFYSLTLRMLEENEKYNLTAIKEPEKIILAHYADCAAIADSIDKGASLIDVGCGAGFPALPLAIVRPDIKIFALDSTAKRINYVKETARLLSLSSVKAEAMRAEDAAKLSEYREAFDYATARAVAELRVLAELTLPFVKVGGSLIAMKGKNAQFELAAAKKAIAILGGKDAKSREITLKNGAETLSHPLITVEKKTHTPAAYPRAFAQISKKPL